MEKRPSPFRAGAIIIAGAVLTGAAVGTIVMSPGRLTSTSQSSGSGAAGEPTLAKVAPSEIAAATVTLDPDSAQSLAADAKGCKTPLAWVILTKQHGSAGGAVRIRSGSYLSPAFRATETPQRIAIPYPAPYPTGKGVLWAIGEGGGLGITLYPTWNISSLHGAAPINVIWTPVDPC